MRPLAGGGHGPIVMATGTKLGSTILATATIIGIWIEIRQIGRWIIWVVGVAVAIGSYGCIVVLKVGVAGGGRGYRAGLMSGHSHLGLWKHGWTEWVVVRHHGTLKVH